VVVFLLLGVIWAAVLIPPWLQSRREARPIASIMSFRSQLWSLERATPRYGADSYVAYGDDVYDDTYGTDTYGVEGAVDDTGEVAEVHPFDPSRRVGGEARVPGLTGTSPAGVPLAAVARRRALAYRRRRQVLAVLGLATVGTLAPAVLVGGPWLIVVAVVSTLLVAYLGLLIRRGRQHAERSQKVRYLTPIRAPRPSVVVIGSGARPVAGG
jgi:hypothetical protein